MSAKSVLHHLMTTILLRDIVDDFINLYEERGNK